MYNFTAKFGKILEICKLFAKNIVNEYGNIPRRGVVPRFSDIEVIALSITAEALGIDSENYLFHHLEKYATDIPNLISRRQYNDRRKTTRHLCETIRKRIASHIDKNETYFCVDSKPLPVCQRIRAKRCKMGQTTPEKAPNFGYCASKKIYFYSYKLHAVCGLSGVIHSYDLAPASVNDVRYLKNIQHEFSNCTIIGDRGYLSFQMEQDLFTSANIILDVPYRERLRTKKEQWVVFERKRKRIETVFSQLDDQMMLIRNYAKQTEGIFTRTIAKVSALTILQYLNYTLNKAIGRTKYALN